MSARGLLKAGLELEARGRLGIEIFIAIEGIREDTNRWPFE